MQEQNTEQSTIETPKHHFLKKTTHLRPHKPSKRLVKISIVVSLIFVFIIIIINSLISKNIHFSASADNCISNISFFPSVRNYNQSETYTISTPPKLSFFGKPVLSTQICATAHNPPLAHSTEVVSISPIGAKFITKKIYIKTDTMPSIVANFDRSQPVGTKSSLIFDLSQEDRLFEYQIVNQTTPDTSVNCQKTEANIQCDLQDLQLAQGSTQTIKVLQTFQQKSHNSAYQGEITTLDPIQVINSSIANGSTIYHAPEEIILELNKSASQLSGLAILDTETNQDIGGYEYALEGTHIIIKLSQALPREKAIKISLEHVEGQDTSQLSSAFSLQFNTSGGPRVKNTSLGKNKTQPSVSINIGFDVDLHPSQNFAEFVQLSVKGAVQAVSVTHTGNSLIIKPTQPMQRCSEVQLQIKPGLVNIHGIGGGQSWQTTSRIICQELFSIGKSVEGRDITAYKFGSGNSAILFVGGMHGNEKSSVATMNDWINYLEDNGHNLPSHRSVIVIPNHNPDGYHKSIRTNANNVDLNRNFPNPDWQSLVYMPGNVISPTGGGLSPLDQPESSALASYVQRLRPSRVLTYHATAGIVISNDAGDSINLARQYASSSNLKMSSNADSNDAFSYTHTGEFEDWLGNVLGIPALLIELNTMSRSEFNTHKSAMWNIVQ